MTFEIRRIIVVTEHSNGKKAREHLDFLRANAKRKGIEDTFDILERD